MKKITLTTLFTCCFIILSLAQIIHVPADQPTIQAGINAAIHQDTVLVEDGIYYENINFKGKAITVASEFIMDGDTNHINNTIIDGSQPLDPDSASVVSFISGEDTASIISGFTITAGTGLFVVMIPARIGGGIVCRNAGAKITHNRIIENEVDYQFMALGAGIGCLIYAENHWIVIENNIIANNYNHVIENGAYGGGIFIGGNTGSNIEMNARVRFNTIENNYCYGELYRADGGGIKIEGSTGINTNLYFDNNLVRNNSIRSSLWTRGAGLLGLRAEALITNNTFLNNYIDTNSINFRGAAICFKYPLREVIIINNQILNNVSPLICETGTGAVSIMDGYEDAKIIVDGNFFTNNAGKNGGGFYSRRSYNLSVLNNVFSGNSAIKGGALALYHPPSALFTPLPITASERPLVINNTFVDNTANNGGGAIRFSGDLNAPIIINSIFWQNSAPTGLDIINESALNIHVSYSDIETDNISGLWEGEENIYEDPLFVNPVNGDFHLNNCESPCINAGIDALEIDSTWYYCPINDIDNETRPYENTLPDIGADETPCLETSIKNREDVLSSTILNIFPNPFQSKTTIEFNIPQSGFITLSVVDFTGKEIQTLVSEQLPAGTHQFNWNAKGLLPGIYFLRLETQNRTQVHKVLIMK